jgi:glycosyltransferase involved in cell wall biosynthesis
MNKRRPRILFVAPLPPPVHGSAVVSKQIMDSQLINDTFSCDWVNMSTSRRMDEVGKFALSKPFRLFASLSKLFWLLLTHRYDLCYLAITCHGKPFIKDVPFVILCKIFGNKIVIHQHNKGMANDVDRWPYRWLLPLAYKNTKVILLSWLLYSDIEKIVPKDNVVICPNGINAKDLFKSIHDTTKEGQNIPHILFLSNLMESKGVIVLLDALEMLKDKGTSFHCVFIGGETKEIDTKRFWDEADKRALKKNVDYYGKKYGKEKESFFSKSDAFVFPSYEDCFPLVILEAMAHGLPIVTTDEGAIPDEVQDGINGLICNKKDPVSLADCLKRVLEDSNLRKELGTNGHQKLLKEFTVNIFERRMSEILKELCSREG